MKYLEVKTLNNKIVDDFIANYNLFALFQYPINVIFIENFRNNIKKYKDVYSGFNMPNNTFFSCKVNKSLALLEETKNQNCGIEVASLYELKDALKFTNKVIASGPAKTKEYIELSIKNNVIISVDDIEELKLIASYDAEVEVFIRLSDLVGIISRFGINISQLNEALSIINDSKIKLIGFSFHINNYNINHRIQAIEEVLEITRKYQLKIKYIDIGGGFPVTYCSKNSYEKFVKNVSVDMFFNNKDIKSFYPYYNEIAEEKTLEFILEKVAGKLNGIEIIIEPGRSLLANCGISIFNIEYIKTMKDSSNIIVTNGNINSISEQWFNSDYLIEPLLYKKNSKNKELDFYASVAGNLCLEQDIITWRKILFKNKPEKNDLLIYYNTAGYQMDSNESQFHKIPLVNKVIVDNVNGEYIIKGDNEYDSK